MNRKEQILKSVLEVVLPQERPDFRGRDASHTFSVSRYMHEYVVGTSLKEIVDRLPAFLDRLRDEKHISMGSLNMRLVEPLARQLSSDPADSLRILLMDNEDAPHTQLLVHKDDEGNTHVDLLDVDVDDIDRPYPEDIGRTTIRGERSSGFCLHQNFGRFVEAMDALRPIMKIPVERPKRELMDRIWAEGDGFLLYGPLLELDGGLAGDLCLEVESEVQKKATRMTMDWARTALPEVISELEKRDCVWDKNFLNHMDLDDSACAIPLDDGRSAVLHSKVNLISDYWAYLAVADRGSDGQVSGISLYALSRTNDHIPAIVKQLQEGTLEWTPNVRHDFQSGETEFLEVIDPTAVANTFSFYLDCDREVLMDGVSGELARDGEVVSFEEKNPFSFDDDEFEDDLPEATAPGMNG